jgi:hypothetical protein
MRTAGNVPPAMVPDVTISVLVFGGTAIVALWPIRGAALTPVTSHAINPQ